MISGSLPHPIDTTVPEPVPATPSTSSDFSSFDDDDDDDFVGINRKSYNKPPIYHRIKKLLERVMPDELNNVDEMMKKFDGREEELVQTLEAMMGDVNSFRPTDENMKSSVQRDEINNLRQTREKVYLPPGFKPRTNDDASDAGTFFTTTSVTSKATTHKSGGESVCSFHSAKDNTTSDATSSNGPKKSRTKDIIENQPKHEREEQDHSEEYPEDEVQEEEQKKYAIDDLDNLIESGDWDAIGECVAGHETDYDTDSDSNSIATTISTLSSASQQLRSIEGLSKEEADKLKSDHASELEELVANDDWEGVANASKAFEQKIREMQMKNTRAGIYKNSENVNGLENENSIVIDTSAMIDSDDISAKNKASRNSDYDDSHSMATSIATSLSAISLSSLSQRLCNIGTLSKEEARRLKAEHVSALDRLIREDDWDGVANEVKALEQRIRDMQENTNNTSREDDESIQADNIVKDFSSIVCSSSMEMDTANICKLSSLGNQGEQQLSKDSKLFEVGRKSIKEMIMMDMDNMDNASLHSDDLTYTDVSVAGSCAEKRGNATRSKDKEEEEPTDEGDAANKVEGQGNFNSEIVENEIIAQEYDNTIDKQEEVKTHQGAELIGEEVNHRKTKTEISVQDERLVKNLHSTHNNESYSNLRKISEPQMQTQVIGGECKCNCIIS